jgi:hypothetical protein
VNGDQCFQRCFFFKIVAFLKPKISRQRRYLQSGTSEEKTSEQDAEKVFESL